MRGIASQLLTVSLLALLVGLISLLTVSGASATERLKGIKGADDRILVDSTEYPWRAIARFNHQGSFCTATLIGPALALTAAHCLFDSPEKGWKKPENIHLLFGYQRGSWIAEGRVKDYTVPRDYVPRALAEVRDYRSAPDWAVLVLVEPVGEATGWMGVAPLTNDDLSAIRKSGQALVQAGYSKDKSHILTVNVPCPLNRIDSQRQTIRHTCDAVPGDSGSPIFTYTKDGFRVAAIHVATATTNTGTWGIAVPTLNYLDAVMAHKPPLPRPPSVDAPPGEATARQLLERMGEPFSDLSLAIRRFEAKQGLTQTGKASPDLLGHLLNAQQWVAPKKALPSYSDLQKLLDSTRVGRAGHFEGQKEEAPAGGN
ncbi:MAG: trypsin-like serine peptidase [Rhodospirillales bacterium]